jgi:cellulose biosynthesis protein BcsQ/tetratricopeptide (TPR) repeat protein
MGERAKGQVVTFFSYKGGTGRTMALANVAWILASNGKRVLVVDWDLDSPGLPKYFQPFLNSPQFREAPGLTEMLTEYAREQKQDRPDRAENWFLPFARVNPYAISLDWPFGSGGALDIIRAGLEGHSHVAASSAFDWTKFFTHRNGAAMLKALREDMRGSYDYTLIDSRTGLSDIAGICTVTMPDTVVNCFTLSDQAIEGADQVARWITESQEERPIRILPVPMRVEDGENAKLEAGRALARARFAGYPRDVPPEVASRYWGDVEVPYKPFYAYEETLAVFGDAPHLASSLLSSFERLTAAITDGEVRELAPMSEERRKRTALSFERRRPLWTPDVFLSHTPEDRPWADWVASVLRRAGIRVVVQGTEFPPGASVQDQVQEAVGQSARTLILLSAAYVRSSQARMVWESLAVLESERGRAPLIPIRIGEVRLNPPFDSWSAIDLSRASESDAVRAVLSAVDHVPGLDEPEAESPTPQPRYPGLPPLVWQVPQRNATFTGRSVLLEQLRTELAAGVAVVMPQALFGLGGIGKTQLVLEYAHRFKSDYDVVWWVPSEQEGLIDGTIAEMAPHLKIRSGENINEAADAVREALRRGDPYSRWLVIFDNADDPATLKEHLPSGSGPNGHVIITSRNSRGWTHMARPLEVDAFTRNESVEHLTRRVPGLDLEAAHAVADLLGDLPLAIELASAYLEESAMPVSDYLQHLRTQLAKWLKENQPTDYPKTAAASWQISIDRLREQSPAAVRLIEICSCFSPEPIAMRLLYNDATISRLVPFDEYLTEKVVLGRVIREISKFALAKVDQGRNSLQVHRLVQAVVRDNLGPEKLESTSHDVHDILVQARPTEGDTDDPENWPDYNDIWPHLDRSNAAECFEEPTRKLLVERVRYLWKRGDLVDGLELAHQLEAKWLDVRDPDDRLLLHLRFHIANILRSQGRVEEALAIDSDVLERQTRRPGRDHFHTLLTAGGLAADLRALGDYGQALDVARDAHERLSANYGEDNPLTLSAANNLAVSMRLMGDMTGARDLDDATLEFRRRVLGGTHPYTLHSAAQLARDLRETGNFTESTDLLRSTLTAYRDTLGPDLPETLRTASSLSVSLRKQGLHEEALMLSRETLDRYQTLYPGPPDNPETVACMLNVACDLSATDARDEALAMAERTYRSYAAVLAESHPFTLVSINNMAICLGVQGHLAEAEQHSRRAWLGLRDRLGPRHPLTLSSALNVANTLVALARADEAREVEEETVELMRKVNGTDHPDTLFCQANLASTLRELHETHRSRQLLTQTIAAMERRLGLDHPLVAATRAGRRTSRDLEPQPV